jgi:hypothetical protein
VQFCFPGVSPGNVLTGFYHLFKPGLWVVGSDRGILTTQHSREFLKKKKNRSARSREFFIVLRVGNFGLKPPGVTKNKILIFTKIKKYFQNT